MNHIDERVRRTLQHRADDLPALRTVPPALGRRARRRIVLNALAAGLAVVVLSAGAVVGVRAISGPRAEEPAASPTPSATHPATSVTGAHACTSGQLRATGALLGAAGSREGAINLTNFSDRTCTLQGRPHITLLRSAGHPITTGIDFMTSPAGWQSNGEPTPSGWPVVTLKAGGSSSFRIRWSNWCPGGRAAPLWRIGIPGSGGVDVINGLEGITPPCNGGSGVPSTVEVGPFEPSRWP